MPVIRLKDAFKRNESFKVTSTGSFDSAVASLWMTNGVVRSLKAIPRPEGSLLLSDGQRQSGSDQ